MEIKTKKINVYMAKKLIKMTEYFFTKSYGKVVEEKQQINC